jgi:hypothetical protein
MTEQKVPAPLFTTRFSQGSRTFFFDVRKSKNDRPFLKITSSSLKGDEKQRSTMMVFGSEVQDFCQAVADASAFIVNA